MRNTRLLFILGLAASILAIPFFAMQLDVEGVDWDTRDFIIMGALLFGSALAIEFALRVFSTSTSRFIACGIILTALFLIWAELAVGIFGTPFAGS